MQVLLPVPRPRDASPAPLRLPEMLHHARVPCTFVHERGARSITCMTLVYPRTFRPASHASRFDGRAWRHAVAAVEVASARRRGCQAHRGWFAPPLVVAAEPWPRLADCRVVADRVANLGTPSAKPGGVAPELLAPLPEAHPRAGDWRRERLDALDLPLVHAVAAYVVSDRPRGSPPAGKALHGPTNGGGVGTWKRRSNRQAAYALGARTQRIAQAPSTLHPLDPSKKVPPAVRSQCFSQGDFRGARQDAADR
jgi:hypothetical protein